MRGVQRLLRRADVDLTVINFVEAMTRLVLGAVVVVLVLAQLGVDTSAILGSLGVAGLTLGFAARDALSNLIAGLLS